MINIHDVYWNAAKQILQNIYQIPPVYNYRCRNYESFAEFKMNLDAKRLYFDR